MQIRLLGTGAADGIPAFHGDCRVCRNARTVGGKEIRSRASALVDAGLKIDIPPDTLMQMHRDRLSAHEWTAVLFTHSDEDHFAVDQLQYALHPFTDKDHLGFSIYANETVTSAIWKRYPDWPMDVVTTKSFTAIEHDGYKVMPVEAMHLSNEDSHNFVIDKGGKKLIYATDTGIWAEQTWDALSGIKADALVIECTDGFVPMGYYGHLDIADCVKVVERLRKQNSLTSKARVVTTHHSHRGNATHEELKEALLPHGMEPGFDGMVFEIC